MFSCVRACFVRVCVCVGLCVEKYKPTPPELVQFTSNLSSFFCDSCPLFSARLRPSVSVQSLHSETAKRFGCRYSPSLKTRAVGYFTCQVVSSLVTSSPRLACVLCSCKVQSVQVSFWNDWTWDWRNRSLWEIFSYVRVNISLNILNNPSQNTALSTTTKIAYRSIELYSYTQLNSVSLIA